MTMLYASPGLRVTMMLAWLAVSAFLLAHLASLFVAEAIGAKVGPMRHVLPIPMPSSPPSPQELGSLILGSSVFPGNRHGSVFTQPSQMTGESLSKPLDLELVGTVVGDQALSYAIIQSAQTVSQSLYRLGDAIPQVGTLVGIHRHHVIIAFENGQHTTLQAGWMQNGADPLQSHLAIRASEAKGEKRTVMPRQEIVEAFSNLPRILQQAKATPIISAAGMHGVSFEVIEAASIFDRLGFQIGDELKSINGVALRDPGTLLTALRQIQHETAVDLNVVRNNQQITMHYDIQ